MTEDSAASIECMTENEKSHTPRINKRYLVKHCRDLGLYETPYLNDVLYLHHKEMLSNLKTLEISNNQLEKAADIKELIHCKQLSVLDLSNNKLENSDAVLEKDLRYLDDRPVFEKERACVQAWSEGGIEAENLCRDQWNENEKKKMQDQATAFLKKYGRRPAEEFGHIDEPSRMESVPRTAEGSIKDSGCTEVHVEEMKEDEVSETTSDTEELEAGESSSTGRHEIVLEEHGEIEISSKLTATSPTVVNSKQISIPIYHRHEMENSKQATFVEKTKSRLEKEKMDFYQRSVLKRKTKIISSANKLDEDDDVEEQLEERTSPISSVERKRVFNSNEQQQIGHVRTEDYAYRAEQYLHLQLSRDTGYRAEQYLRLQLSRDTGYRAQQYLRLQLSRGRDTGYRAEQYLRLQLFRDKCNRTSLNLISSPTFKILLAEKFQSSLPTLIC
ncbi:unnamed protein product [Cyprideis torosa]|uniref:Uncharacterized protein n=1 Tax=Cyprideis torosa TaxID=163714 RepID=A0A7R8W7P9_9CRUS|nr:unnamed protein product [Cyprideis torosa]CAG0882931.1 unnamed protein product [Cyprideis torosa]